MFVWLDVMAKTREKEGKVAHESVEKRDAMDIVNDLSLDEFSHLYVMEGYVNKELP